MPELPEVETIVQHLRRGTDTVPTVMGMTITGVTVRWPGHIACPSLSTFRRRIRGRTIADLRRRGKYLVFELDRGALLIHLKMSGDLLMAPGKAPRDRFERTTFRLGSRWELRFSDARKFGRVYLVHTAGEVLGSLGPEPLDPGLTAKAFALRLARHRRMLKPLLLDQAFLAGVGNIYADEGLHRAGLHPLRRSHTLEEQEARSLWRGIRAALRHGLRRNGASIDWVYRGGGFQNHFRVYQRTGEPCLRCGTAIARLVTGQRSTHFCPSCQPEKRS